MTVKDLLARAAHHHPDRVAFRYREKRIWRELTYGEFLCRVRSVADMLAEAGVRPGDRIAIFAENSIHWPTFYFAIVGLGAIAVPVDAKLREQEASHVLSDSQAAFLFITRRELPIVREVQHLLPSMTRVFVLHGRDLLPGTERPIFVDYDEALMAAVARTKADPGERIPAYDRVEPKEEDIASFIYTSGTTGRQKGVMLTHRNFTSNVEACRQVVAIRPDENYLLVLPLHHAFAFTGNLLLPISGANTISLVESLRTVGDNIRELSPTAFIGVPLLLEKMYDRILAGLRKNRFGYLLYRLGIRGPIRRGIRERLGGRLRIIITGGAPCAPDVLYGFAQLGITILEGYGLTETSPVISINPADKPKPGTIGKPVQGVEIRIDEPAADGVGELLVRGPNVMKGYFNDPEASRRAMAGDWFRTGDLAYLDPEGYIVLAGRKKSLIVDRSGKNIHPEEIEGIVLQSPYVLEALCLGYRERSDRAGEQVGLIVVPNQERLDAVAAETGRPLSDREVISRLRGEVKVAVAEIASFKRPRRIQVRMEEFEKTSTGKIKRYLYELPPTEL
jgi:long-chain acyl-CoA synthetase